MSVNLSLQEKSEMFWVRDLMFTDNSAFVAFNQLKRTSNNHPFLEICKCILGRKWTSRKPRLCTNSLPVSHNIGQDILIEGYVRSQENKFKYLGSTVANNNRLNVELDARTSNTCKSFDELCLTQHKRFYKN